MNDLVFLAPNTEEPFTTSEAIADHKEFLAHTQRKEEVCHV